MPQPDSQIAITDTSGGHIAYGLAVAGNRWLVLAPTKALDGQPNRKRHAVEVGREFKVAGEPATVVRSSYGKSLTTLLLAAAAPGAKSLDNASVKRGDTVYAHDGADWVELSVAFAAAGSNIRLARITPSADPETDDLRLVGAPLWSTNKDTHLIGIVHDATGGGRFLVADVRLARRSLPFTEFRHDSTYQPLLTLRDKLANLQAALVEHEDTGVTTVTENDVTPCHTAIVELTEHQAGRDGLGHWLVGSASEMRSSYITWVQAAGGIGGISVRASESKGWSSLRAGVFGELNYLEEGVLQDLADRAAARFGLFDSIVWQKAYNETRTPIAP